MVSYSNTKPFLYGFQLHNSPHNFDLNLLHPAACANAYKQGEVDIALVPTAFLNKLEDFKVITNYCIGCNGSVNTVGLFSHVPLEDLTHIILDNHSMTSVALLRVLLKDYWKHDVILQSKDVIEELAQLNETEGVLMIGDKVFTNQEKFEYKYDLGKFWKLSTGLPFAFAVWICRDSVSKEVTESLNSILEFGVSRIDEIVEKERDSSINYKKYLISQISYNLNAEKRKSLHHFLARLKTL